MEEFYKIKAGIRACGMYGGNKTKILAERKHELKRLIKQALDKVTKMKADKIRKKLWDELGVVI